MCVCILCASVHVSLVYVMYLAYLNIYLLICWFVCFNTHLFTYVYNICVNNPCLNFLVNLCLNKYIYFNNLYIKKKIKKK